MPILTGKRILLEMFLAEGVEYMFGNPGTSEAPMIDIMHEYPKINYVLALQEGVAVGIADGYWRSSGKTPLVSLHIDNGLANGLSLMIDQKYTYAPMVVTAGNKDIRKLAAGRSDLADMARPFVKWASEITWAEQVASTIRRAFQEARAPLAGPAFVAMSANAFDETANTIIQPSTPVYPPLPDIKAIEAASSIIANAQNPLLVVGDRVYEYGGNLALNAAVALAESAGMKVCAHYSSSVNFPANHPLWQGKIQPREPKSLELLRNSDVIVAAGCPAFEDYFYLSEQILNPNTKLIHIDVATDEIGRSEHTSVGIVAQPYHTMVQLAQAVVDSYTSSQKDSAKERVRQAEIESQLRREEFQAKAAREIDKFPMTETAMAKAIADALPQDSYVFNDGISVAPSVFQAISPSSAGRYFSGRGQAIGWGIGATIGLQLGSKGQPVIGIIGDGSAMMTIQGLWTAVNESLPAVFVICNNSSYRVLKINMNHYRRLIGKEEKTDKFFAMDFQKPIDFVAQAKAYGANGVRVTNPAELTNEIRRAIDSNAPTVIDAIIDKSI